MNRARPDLVGQPGRLMLGRPVPHHQAGPASPKRGIQVRQALEQELGSRTGGVATVQQAVVEAEHRHHSVVTVKRRAKRGVIVQPQIAAKPDEGRSTRDHDAAARCSESAIAPPPCDAKTGGPFRIDAREVGHAGASLPP